jgi:hypothetical protein
VTPVKEQPGRATSLLPGEERRRSQRVIIRIPVTLVLTMSGQQVRVPGHTVAVNIHGAMVQCVRSLDANTQFEILNDRTGERTGARVTRASRESAGGYLIPIEFSKPSPSFWQISFPSTDWKPSDG